MSFARIFNPALRPRTWHCACVRCSDRLENLEFDPEHQLFHPSPVLGHVRRYQMLFQGWEVSPFLDHGHCVVAQWGLGGNARIDINSGAIFEASHLGLDLRHQLMELRQESVSFSFHQIDRGNHMDHASHFRLDCQLSQDKPLARCVNQLPLGSFLISHLAQRAFAKIVVPGKIVMTANVGRPDAFVICTQIFVTAAMHTDNNLIVGTKLRVAIDDIAFGGEGVGRAGEFVVFVPFVLVGEEAEVEITEVKRRFARARLIGIIKPSPNRVVPLCPYFGACGGCQYQHVAYPVQLELKRKQITDLFERVGGFTEAVVDPVEPCPQPYGYRNRIMVRSQWDKFKQALNIGFLRADSRLVVDIEECKIAEPLLNIEVQEVRKNPPPKGGIKVAMRVPPEGWEVPRDSFFQNNFHLLPKLVDVVRERVRSSGVRHLVDVYCGVGFFSVELADLVESFIGVELDKMAVEAARRNATNHHRLNGEYLLGRAEDLLPSIMTRFPPKETVVILDPPRTGCLKESLDLLRQVRPAQILYISCHPATLARDLSLLCAEGMYSLSRVTPLDMFPQTQHVECVADLREGLASSPKLEAVPCCPRLDSIATLNP